ncbi:hypothetical protein [Acidiferrobacter sp. SPIII_3]|uniref:hypothetical protein n=1 Tax=Acidiferrobacter sp. SPIII_3 TaxID=1281578 RepID=UPI00143CC7C2|nr:hypothetical protein [Acidiferrobacter sp. SPIII_3]
MTKAKSNVVRMFQPMQPMQAGTPAALRRAGKTTADRARQRDSKLSGKSREEVLALLTKKSAG